MNTINKNVSVAFKAMIFLASITMAKAQTTYTWARSVESFSGGPGTGSGNNWNDPHKILGIPDASGVDETDYDGFLSLGVNGSIILSFGAGFQSEGTSAPDLFCWEYGGTAESYTVSVSSDGINFHVAGSLSGTVSSGGWASGGGYQTIDLDAVSLTGVYNYVKIDDNNNLSTSLPFKGADIDAVAVPESAIVPEPSSALLVGFGVLSFLFRRRY